MTRLLNFGSATRFSTYGTRRPLAFLVVAAAFLSWSQTSAVPSIVDILPNKHGNPNNYLQAQANDLWASRAKTRQASPVNADASLCVGNLKKEMQFAYDESPKCYGMPGNPVGPLPPPSPRPRPNAPPFKQVPSDWVLPNVIYLPSPPPGTPFSDDTKPCFLDGDGSNTLPLAAALQEGLDLWVCPGFMGVFCFPENARPLLSWPKWDKVFAYANENCDLGKEGNLVPTQLRCTVGTFGYGELTPGYDDKQWHDNNKCSTTAECFFPNTCVFPKASVKGLGQGYCRWPVSHYCVSERADGRVYPN